MRKTYVENESCSSSQSRGNLELVERNIPDPARNQVRIKVEACGICHSDALVKEGHWPGIQYPRVPDTKSLAASTPLAPTSPTGNPASASESAGMAAIALLATPAAAAIS